MTIHFLYRGDKPPAFSASVDITIIVKPSSSPCLTNANNSSNPRNLPPRCRMIEPSINCEFYLVPHRRNGSQWRLLKLLVALQNSKDERGVEIRCKFVPSSYAIKTCLLQYMKTVDPSTWSSTDISATKRGIELVLTHAIGILRHYSLRSAEIFSFFDQKIKALDVTQSSQSAVLEIIAKLIRLI